MTEKSLTRQEIQPDAAYRFIRQKIVQGRQKIYASVNTAMMEAYWEMGEQISVSVGETTAPSTARAYPVSCRTSHQEIRQSL